MFEKKVNTKEVEKQVKKDLKKEKKAEEWNWDLKDCTGAPSDHGGTGGCHLSCHG